MKFRESGIEFEFPDTNTTIKFDEDAYYRKYFLKMHGAKGIDFLSNDKEKVLFIEVKNCRGSESENRWRIWPDNKKVHTLPTPVNVEGRDSLDIEMAKKVAMSIVALVGAYSHNGRRETANIFAGLTPQIVSPKIAKDQKKWYIILFLEGEFQSQTRNKKMIMGELQKSIQKKLSWLNCKVSVVDSHTYNNKLFQVKL